MNRKLSSWLPILIVISFLSINARAQEPEPAAACRQTLAPVSHKIATTDTCDRCVELSVSMKDLERYPENYYGKTVTIEGQMHLIFTDNVFTIEDNGFVRDKDILVISTVPRAEAVTPLEGSIESGKDVRITGVVHPYDRGRLECAYGPLHLESHEGHSFTKNPVIIV